MEKHIGSELSSPWNAPSLQAPLLEFLPGIGKLGAVIVSVVPIPAPSKGCHFNPVSIRAREIERERESKRQKENQGLRYRERERGIFCPHNLSIGKINIRDVFSSPVPGPKGSRLPPSLVFSSPPDSHLETFIECVHARPRGGRWREIRQEHQ